MEQAAKAVRFRFSAGGCSSILPPCYCTESGRHLSRVSVKIVAIALRGLGLFGMGCGGRVFVGYVLGVSRRCAPQRGRTSPAAFRRHPPPEGDDLSRRCAPPSPRGGGNYLGVCVGLAGGWARRYGPLPALRATLPQRGRECPGGCVGLAGNYRAANRCESTRIVANRRQNAARSRRIAADRCGSTRIVANRCESTRIVANRRQNAVRSRRITA